MLWHQSLAPPVAEIGDRLDRTAGPLPSSWTTENISGGDATKVPVGFNNGIRMTPATANNTNFQAIAVLRDQHLPSDNMRVYGLAMSANGGLIGGVMARCSQDRQNSVFAISNTSACSIQYRSAGTFSTVQAQVMGNFFALNDYMVLDCIERQFILRRLRGSTWTDILTWNDASAVSPRSVGGRGLGYVGQCDRNAFGTQGFGMSFSEIIGQDLAA